METLRRYGSGPWNVALIHGGPGAGGEMAPVARALADSWGILEPIQRATTLEGQVEELRALLEARGDLPVTLVGYSWGAWLSLIVAARYPALVGKLILVGSGPFEERYVAQLQETRMSRLDEQERAAFASALARLRDPEAEDKDTSLAVFGALAAKADTYDPIALRAEGSNPVGHRGDIYQGVWTEAAAMRRSGALLALAGQVRCPVVAVHGDYDPHPAEGVRVPLAASVERLRWVLLERCGHTPWLERQARDAFYQVLREELPRSPGASKR